MEQMITIKQPSLYDMEIHDLVEWLESVNEKPFRAKQIYDWLYDKGVRDASEMQNVPQALREKLQQTFRKNPLEVVAMQESVKKDTQKLLFRLYDGYKIESVFMYKQDHQSLCISSQVGCAVDCQFCATGKMGFFRSLSAGEIVSQFMFFKKDHSIDNIVFMGMGEPFLNTKEVFKAIRILSAEEGLNFSQRRITVSTSGIIKGIDQLSDSGLGCRLAVSLTAAIKSKREQLMPITKHHPLDALIEAVKRYQQKTNKRITFEYVCLPGINMLKEDVEALILLREGLSFNLNLIPYNPNPLDPYSAPTTEEMETFKTALNKSKRFNITQRFRHGRDIRAACGQLAASQEKTAVG